MCRNSRLTGVFPFRLNSLQAEKALFDWPQIQVCDFCRKRGNWPQSRSRGGFRRLDGIRFQISENNSQGASIWKCRIKNEAVRCGDLTALRENRDSACFYFMVRGALVYRLSHNTTQIMPPFHSKANLEIGAVRAFSLFFQSNLCLA